MISLLFLIFKTGGNNSAVDSIAKFITAQLRVTRIEDILGQFVELLKQFKFLGVKALQNYLFGFSESVTPPNEYQAQYNTIPAYRDSETITNTNSVVSRFEDLIDSLILVLLLLRILEYLLLKISYLMKVIIRMKFLLL